MNCSNHLQKLDNSKIVNCACALKKNGGTSMKNKQESLNSNTSKQNCKILQLKCDLLLHLYSPFNIQVSLLKIGLF